VILDMDEGVLGFMADGKYLGTAFSGLRGKKLFLTVSAVWGHCEISMKYIAGLERKFPLIMIRNSSANICIVSSKYRLES
jgi:hypothetical protein